MKKHNSRTIVLVVLALSAAFALVVISAVASIFAYRTLSEAEGIRARVDLEDLDFGQYGQVASEEPATEQGVIILRVEPGGPAELAGLTSGSLILSVNGQEVNSPQELREVIRSYDVGDTVTLTVKTGEETSNISVTLAESGPYLGVNVGPNAGRFFHRGDYLGDIPPGFVMPRFPGAPGESEKPERAMPFDFPFDEFGQEPFGDHERFFDLLGSSALVMSVIEDSPAAAAGLQAGDAVVEANNLSIDDSQDLIDLVASLSPGDALDMEVQRGGDSISVEVTLDSHPDEEDRAYLGVFLAPGRLQGQMEFFDHQQNS
jgi:S1-C subfamily serine protease